MVMPAWLENIERRKLLSGDNTLATSSDFTFSVPWSLPFPSLIGNAFDLVFQENIPSDLESSSQIVPFLASLSDSFILHLFSVVEGHNFRVEYIKLCCQTPQHLLDLLIIS